MATYTNEESLAGNLTKEQLNGRTALDKVIINDWKPAEAAIVTGGSRDGSAGILKGGGISSYEAVEDTRKLLLVCRSLCASSSLGKGIVVACGERVIVVVDGGHVRAGSDDLCRMLVSRRYRAENAVGVGN